MIEGHSRYLCTSWSLATIPTCTSTCSPLAFKNCLETSAWQFQFSCWRCNRGCAGLNTGETATTLPLCRGLGRSYAGLGKKNWSFKAKSICMLVNSFDTAVYPHASRSCQGDSALLTTCSNAAGLFLWEAAAVSCCRVLWPNAGSGCTASDGAGLSGYLWPWFRNAVKHTSS